VSTHHPVPILKRHCGAGVDEQTGHVGVPSLDGDVKRGIICVWLLPTEAKGY
jgi:hypothetical protein